MKDFICRVKVGTGTWLLAQGRGYCHAHLLFEDDLVGKDGVFLFLQVPQRPSVKVKGVRELQSGRSVCLNRQIDRWKIH